MPDIFMKAKTEIPQRTKKRPERAPEYLTG
jgi:hypothetical protein